ncbi:MAG: Gldg family protein [Desulfobacterales bacterium]|nr:Gldg family protein [Desulfobacterales bacterium]
MASKSEKYIKFIIYLVAVVLINLVSSTLFFRIDLTQNKLYSISKASKEVISTISEPLTINVFFTKNLPAPYNNIEKYLHDLIEEYSAYSNSFFNYRFYDVSAEEMDSSKKSTENQELAKNYGIYPVQIQLIEKDEVKFQKAYMGVVLIHGDMIEKIPTITSTDKLEYKLTTAIQKMNNKISALLRLPEKIEIKLFISSSLMTIAPYMGLDKLPELPKDFTNVIEKLNNRNYGKLNFEYIDPAKNAKFEPILKQYNILKLKWPALYEKKVEAGEGYIGMIMTYANKGVEIPIINILQIPLIGTKYDLIDMANLEEVINQHVETLININEDIGYLADHGTLNLWGDNPMMQQRQEFNSASNLKTLASQNYSIKDIKLSETKITDSFNCLIIAGPKEPFNDYELFQIDQYLMRGKNLAIFLDGFKEVNYGGGMGGNVSYTPLDTGLEKLLNHYGVSIKKSYVLDENCYKQRVPQEYGGGERAVYFAPIIKKQKINSKLTFMENIKGLICMKNSPLSLDTKRISDNGLKAFQVFSSSDRSWEMSGQINLNPMFMQAPKADEQKSFPLAYLIEGEFPSYFAGKQVPEKPEKKKDIKETDLKDGDKVQDDSKKEVKQTSDPELSKIKGEGNIIPKGKTGKIFIVGSSEMLKDNIIDDEGKSPNATFVMNVLDGLNNRQEIASMRSKEQIFNPLNDTTSALKTSIKSVNIVGLPIFVAIFGLIVFAKRQRRKNSIKEMFQ